MMRKPLLKNNPDKIELCMYDNERHVGAVSVCVKINGCDHKWSIDKHLNLEGCEKCGLIIYQDDLVHCWLVGYNSMDFMS